MSELSLHFWLSKGEKSALRQVWFGTAVAVAICITVGVVLDVISAELPQRQQEGLETVIGVIAVAMVSYMILWMRHHARSLKKDLESATKSALATGSAKALVLMAFLAVLREGFETAVFLLATFNATNNAASSVLGAVFGILLAVVLGYAIYKGGVKINLARFFRVTGGILVLVAAGLLATAFGTANEAGWFNIDQVQAFDLSRLVRPGTPLESIFTGVLGIPAYPTWPQVIAWVVFFVPMITLITFGGRSPRTKQFNTQLNTTASASSKANTDTPPVGVSD
ncbi:MAG: iron uptake transporter permease EfeU [Actinomycetota bacterium]